MLEKKVWTPRKLDQVPKNRRILGSKWVFKLKEGRLHRARLVAQGFNQIPGVDFTDSYAPVVQDMTLRMLLTLMIIKDMKAEVIDVETAFLYGDLEEEIYMKVPDGLKQFYSPDVCLELGKSIYGCIQAARQWWKRFIAELKRLGFVQSLADPCLLIFHDERGVVYFVIYVDDCIIFSSTESLMKQFKRDVAKVFNIKELGELRKYLGCFFDRHENKIKIVQPELITSFTESFKIPTGPRGTPAVAGQVLLRGHDPADNVNDEQQKTFRSGIGKLLHLTAKSRPEIANSVREISKFMDGATPAHINAMYRIMRYVIATPQRGLEIAPDLSIKGYEITEKLDTDYAKDPTTC